MLNKQLCVQIEASHSSLLRSYFKAKQLTMKPSSGNKEISVYFQKSALFKNVEHS